MGSLENISPTSPLTPGPELNTMQQISPPTADCIDIPEMLQSTGPTLSFTGPPSQHPVYVRSSMPSAAQPTPVVSRYAFTATDQPHPPWQQQQDSNWPTSAVPWSVPPSAGQFGIPGTMQYPPTRLPAMPTPGSLPWTSGPPVGQPHVAPVLPPPVGSQYNYQYPVSAL